MVSPQASLKSIPNRTWPVPPRSGLQEAPSSIPPPTTTIATTAATSRRWKPEGGGGEGARRRRRVAPLTLLLELVDGARSMPSWPGAGRSPSSRSGVSGGLPAAAGATGARDADGGRRTTGRRRSGPGRGRPRGCGVACYRWRGPPCRRSSCPSPESCPFSVLVPWDWIGLRRRSQYLEELLQEQQKLGPFVQVLPICGRLLNQEIMRISSMLSHLGVRGNERLPPIASPNHMPPLPRVPNFCGNGFGPWNGMHPERNGVPRGAMGWQGAAQNHSSYIVKKIVRLEVPTDAYPNFNFIGRLLGPRGHSLKRVEATTGCRVFIRGKGSIKDPVKEEQLKGRPGYEHLGDPTHILIEAELPADVIDAKLAQAQEILEELLKPVDESQDNIKRQQLRELAMLNSVYREDSPHQNGSASPFSNGGTKQ